MRQGKPIPIIGHVAIVVCLLVAVWFVVVPSPPDEKRNTVARMINLTMAVTIYEADEEVSKVPLDNGQLIILLATPHKGQRYIDTEDNRTWWCRTMNQIAPRLSKNGEYLDAWGTPLRISESLQVPGGIKVQSFGPNRQDDGGKPDDIVIDTQPRKK